MRADTLIWAAAIAHDASTHCATLLAPPSGNALLPPIPTCSMGMKLPGLTSPGVGEAPRRQGGAGENRALLKLWGSPVEALAVTNGGVVPGKGQQHAAELIGKAGGGTGEMLVVGEGSVEVQLDLAGGRMIAGLAPAQQFLVAAGSV